MGMVDSCIRWNSTCSFSSSWLPNREIAFSGSLNSRRDLMFRFSKDATTNCPEKKSNLLILWKTCKVWLWPQVKFNHSVTLLMSALSRRRIIRTWLFHYVCLFPCLPFSVWLRLDTRPIKYLKSMSSRICKWTRWDYVFYSKRETFCISKFLQQSD